MTKSLRAKKKSKKSRNLALPLLLGGVLLTSILGYYFYRQLLTPLQVAEITPTLPKITFSNDCNTPSPTTTLILWHGPVGSIKQIEIQTYNGSRSYSKPVDPNTNSTDLTGFVGTDLPDNPDKGKPFIPDRNTIYKAWAWYGDIKLPDSGGFKPYDCLNDPPVPAPTGMTHTCSQDGTKVSLKWDDNSPSKKYMFSFKDASKDTLPPQHANTIPDVWRGGDYEGSTYELTILPGRQYQWWIATMANGTFSKNTKSALMKFTCTPNIAKPNNPRHTCAPDGKTVRMMWDSVADSDFYKLRLDDKKGNVQSIDGISGKTEYMASISPGQTYSWWAHASKSGYDSPETERKEFKCDAASTPTPTPKPTVNPTVRPTPTPTPSPINYPSPSPRVLFDNTPQTPTLQAEVPPPTDELESPLTTPLESTKQPGALSRFFSWLASLFE